MGALNVTPVHKVTAVQESYVCSNTAVDLFIENGMGIF